jgi:CubicO group peptidase (beta-lactamase class C family)
MLWNRLLQPIGFSGISFDRPPNPPTLKWSTGGGLKMTPRDFARFAYFLLHDGKWGTEQILPKDWLKRLITTPYYKNLRSNRDYFFGRQYPIDMYRIYGSGGNFAFIIPSQNMIAIRTGRVPNFFHDILQRDFLRRTFHMVADIPKESESIKN